MVEMKPPPLGYYSDPFYQQTRPVKGGIAETHFIQAGAPGSKAWLEAQSEARRWEEARRIALEKQLAEGARRAREVEAQRKALAEARQKAIEQRQIQQQARRIGKTIQQIQQQRKALTQKQLQVVQVAEGLRGQELTRTQYQKELARQTGLSIGKAVSTLRKGTARIKIEKFKPVTEFYQDPTKKGFVVPFKDKTGARYIPPSPPPISFDDLGGTSFITQGFDFGDWKLDLGKPPEPTYKITETGYIPTGTKITPPKEFPVEALPTKPLTIERRDVGWLQKKYEQQETQLFREGRSFDLAVKEAGLGLGLSLVSGAKLVEQTFLDPIETTKAIVTSIPKIPAQIPVALAVAGERPSLAVGYIAGEGLQAVALGKALSVFKKVKITKPLRPVKTPYFTEKQMFVVSKGKEFKLSTYDIIGEYKPPMIEKVTTKFREALGFKPIKVTYIPPKKFSIKTLGYAVGEKPFDVSLFKEGKRAANIFEIKGVSKFIEPKIDIGKLTKVEKFAVQRLAEAKTGIPVSEKALSKIFKKGADISISDIQVTKLARAEPSMKSLSLKLKEAGKTRELAKAVTETKPFLETPTTKIFTAETYFKDVSKPFARAIGKTPKLRGVVYQLKEPLILSTEKLPKFISPAGITKTPLAKTFQALETKQILKPLPKPSLKIPEVKTVMKIITPSKVKTPTLASLSQLKLVTDLGVIEGRIPRGILDERIITKVRQQPKLKEITKLKQIPKVKEISKLKEITKIKQIPKLKLQPKIKQVSKLKQLQKIKQLPKLKIITKPKTKYFPLLTIPKIPKIPEKIITPSKILFGEPKRKIPRGRYVVSVRRFGKFRPIGKLPSLSKAFAVGKERVSKTLAASFKVTGIPKISERLPKGFYRSRKEAGVFIEKLGRRLKKGTQEIPEIQFFKRKKKRRKKKK